MPSPTREHTLGIDEGTTGVRALVLHASGRVAGHAYIEIAQLFPSPGWLEQDPEEIWRATSSVIRRALAAAKLRPSDIAAVGVTNQRGSAVLFQSDGGALGPAISWQDQRTAARCRELLAAGIFVAPLTASTKYEWLIRHHGAVVARSTLRCGTIDAWLAHRLTGGAVHATDHSNASCSGLYDFISGTYDQRILAALDLEPSIVPALVDSSAAIGETTRKGFGARVPLASLSGDQHAAMYALACHAPASVKLSLGTSGMMDANSGESIAMPPPGAYPLVLWSLDGKRTFCLEGTTVTAGAAVQWLRDGLGIIKSIAEIEPLARSVRSSQGVWIVPALQGLGTPHLDAKARGTIGGLTRATTRAHLARALLEGIAWRSREVFDALTAQFSERPQSLRVDGGAARNDLLLELLADALGMPVERPAVTDSAALGAAQLAGRAVGLWSDAEVVARWQTGARFEPRNTEAERASGLARWQHRVAVVREAGT
jgi:glycerol kinase